MRTPELITIDDLTEQQAAWVHAWLALGARKGMASRAMQQVNPDLTAESARTTASKYMRNPKIAMAMRNLADSSLKGNVLLAQDILTDIMEGEYNGQPVKPETAMKAAIEVLNRGGLIVAQKVEHEHTIEDNRSEKELLAHIKGRLKELGIADGGVIDAKFEEIDTAAPYGRKEDGLPAAKPGRKPWKRKLIPPPQKDPSKMSPDELRRHEQNKQVAEIRDKLKAARVAARKEKESD